MKYFKMFLTLFGAMLVIMTVIGLIVYLSIAFINLEFFSLPPETWPFIRALVAISFFMSIMLSFTNEDE